ncbi:hypothetical protein MVEN_02235200 [Mycena venus]|uniref:DUF6534 domain-containing protein n=1 Tax=Mycena venus TaxID=2733690 RepID=A0A8H6X7A3_9AGAR|nr:hypothetical protein MVEN_02235200 [Mycena venus]
MYERLIIIAFLSPAFCGTGPVCILLLPVVCYTNSIGSWKRRQLTHLSLPTMSLSTQSPVALHPNFAPLVSSKLLASHVNLFFFGTLVIQVYVFRLCFSKDPLSLKLLVYFVFLAVAVCTFLNVADIEVWFGVRFGNIELFLDLLNAWFYSPIMGTFIATLVQLFFCYRIFVLWHTDWPLTLLIATISLAQLAGGIGCGILVKMAQNEEHDKPRTIFVYLWLVGGALSDVIIAITMTVLLLKAAVVGSTPTRMIVKNTVRLIIETNAFTSIVALTDLILFLAFPRTTYSFFPSLILPAIYANTLLYTLNNRAISRFIADSEFVDFNNLTSVRFSCAENSEVANANMQERTRVMHIVVDEWRRSESYVERPEEAKLS